MGQLCTRRTASSSVVPTRSGMVSEAPASHAASARPAAAGHSRCRSPVFRRGRGACVERRNAVVRLADLAPLPGGVVRDAREADAVGAAAHGCDVAITSLPAAIGTVALPALLAAGVPTVDTSFTVDLSLDLDADAHRAGVPVLVDLGVAPGWSHRLAAALVCEPGEVDTLRILVGGMPLTPPAGFHHAVYFQVLDLMDEYLRPARVRRDGRQEAVDPLAETTRWVDAAVGALEAAPSDGLRSLLTSFPGADHSDHRDHRLREVHAERGEDARARRVHVQRGDGLTAMSRATAFTAAAGAVVLAELASDGIQVEGGARLRPA